MDLLTVIKLALFVPFFLVLAIFAAVYLTAGYKKDLGRSIVSLLATALATGLSLLLAKLISSALSGTVFAALTSVTDGLDVNSLGAGFVKGALEIVLSFVLFVLFFIITLAVLKSVGKKIKWGALEKLNTGKKGTRLAGMALRGIDAVLVSVMLLLPIYGTIATVAPPAAALLGISARANGTDVTMQISEEPAEPIRVQFAAVSVRPAAALAGMGEADAVEIMNTLADHPVLVPYKYGPGSWVYSELSSFSMNGKQVDIATAAESLEGLLDRFEKCTAAIESENMDATAKATQELIDYARKKVINQRWSYDMVMAFVGEIDTLLDKYADELSEEEELLQLYDMARPLLDMSFEDYTNNAEGILDITSWLIDIYGKVGNGKEFTEAEEDELEIELFGHLGRLLNQSKQAVGLKRIILQMYAQEQLFDGMPNSVKLASSFIAEYFGDGYADENERSKEACAILRLLEADDGVDVAEAFARNPLFGAEAVLKYTDENLYIHGLWYGDELAENEKAEEVFSALDEMLKKYENASLTQPLCFKDEVERYLAAEVGIDHYSGSFDFDFDGDYYYSSFDGEDIINGDSAAAGGSFFVKIEK